MKFTLKYKMFACALAALVVLGGGGITVFEHICNASGHADVSVMVEDNCCSSKDENSCEGCCTSNTYSQKIEISASKTEYGEELVSAPILAVLQTFFAQLAAEKSSQRYFPPTEYSPPRLQGRYLHFLQSYLI